MNEVDIKHYESGIQANELSRAIYNCSMTARKIIAYASTRIYEKQVEKSPFGNSTGSKFFVPAAEFKISEFKKSIGDKSNNYDLVKKAVNELRHCSIEIKENDDEFRIWNWFQFIQYSKKNDRIELHFSSELGWALYNLKEKYTVLNLRTVGEFKSFFAFRFYEIALSWINLKGRNGNKKGTWWFQMTPEDIRKTFKIADTAYQGRMDNFIFKVITNPLKELNKINTEFKIEPSKIVRGRDLVAFRFDCTETPKEAKKNKISKSDTKKIRNEKREQNDEQEKIFELRKLYADRWQEVYEFEMKQPFLLGNKNTQKTFAENSADKTLLQEFGDKI